MEAETTPETPAETGTPPVPHAAILPQEHGVELKCGRRGGKVILDFSQSVTWIGMSPDQADALADKLRSHAMDARYRNK